MTTDERKAAFLASLRTMDRAQLASVLATVTAALDELQTAAAAAEDCQLDEDVYGELRELL